MKRTLKFLVRLYPSIWRKRYGAEFDALLEDAAPSARDAFDIFWGALKMRMKRWSFGRIVLACSFAGILVAATIAFAIPTHYVSEDMLTVNPADETALGALDDLSPDIFSEESLAALIRKHNLYPRERAHLPFRDVIDKMRSRIRVQAVAPGWPGALKFAVSIDYPDRQAAEQITAELASAFMEGKLDAAHSHSDFWLGVTPARPVGPNRAGFLGVGLLAGLLAGLVAGFVKLRRGGKLCPTCGHRMIVYPTHVPGISGESGNLPASVGSPR